MKCRYYSFYLLIFCCCVQITATSQNADYISQGKIEYERSINIHILITGNDQLSEAIRKNTNQFKIDEFELLFNNNKTFYRPKFSNSNNNNLWLQPAENNVVLTDLLKGMQQSQKQIFDKKFLIKDSIRNIAWKLTSETRTIAGFECRRANAIILDSVYVVAFFAEGILTKGGPESFNGLPGMILGLVLPHHHISWFAKKIFNFQINEKDLGINSTEIPTTNSKFGKYLFLNIPADKKYKDWYIISSLL